MSKFGIEQFVSTILSRNGQPEKLSKKMTRKLINDTFQVIPKLAKEKPITLRKFGRFSVRRISARNAPIVNKRLPATNVLNFKQTKALRDELNK